MPDKIDTSRGYPVRVYITMDQMIDEMLAAGKDDDEILSAIAKEYEPYDTHEAFGKGMVDGFTRTDRSQDYDGVAGQAYDRGAEAAMYFLQMQYRRRNPIVKA